MSEKTNDTIEDKIDEKIDNELKDSSSTEETETAIKEEKTGGTSRSMKKFLIHYWEIEPLQQLGNQEIMKIVGWWS